MVDSKPVPTCESIRQPCSASSLNPSSGPLISPFAKDRVTSLIASAEQDGGKILLDGRNIKTPEKYPYGNFVGPTIIQGGTSMKCYECVHSRSCFNGS